ncbi:MAG TPA: FAD-binding oxidoreductase [Gemmatimonadaceae bacterium]|nr:FAD-binding oxidoreductase [Gemmatimonadaceae bacterium]
MKPDGFQGTWREDIEARAVYSESAGILRSIPAAVAIPRDAEDVQRVLRHASASGYAVTARGAGSSMPGGAVGEGFLLDMSAMNWIGAVDSVGGRVRAGPGATCAAIQRAAALKGLRFPVDPSSGSFCTVGGMVGTNAAGPHSLRFGPTSDWVSALECVFADGSKAVLRRGAPFPRSSTTLERVAARVAEWQKRAAAIPPLRVRKNSSGYAIHRFAASGDPIDLLVGSEGTLAIVVAVEVRLVPAPLESAAILSEWPDLESALRGAAVAREAGCASCEILDSTFLELVRSSGTEVSAASAAILFTELEADAPLETFTLWGRVAARRAHDGLRARAAALQQALAAAGASRTRVAVGSQEITELWSVRHRASPAISTMFPGLRSVQVVEDGCVPPEHFAEYVRRLRTSIAQRGFGAVLFGHAGDAHMHANVLVDVSSPRWRQRLEELLHDVAETVASLRGTLAGEHGDGRLRSALLDRIWPPEAITLFREIKETFDPGWVLNPGVKLWRHGYSYSVKFDPAAEPLPEQAARVLEFVAARQAYDRPRLALLDAARTGDLGS